MQPTLAETWWIGGLTLALGAILLTASSRRTRQAFAILERNEAALQRSNDELRASRDRSESLAHHVRVEAENRERALEERVVRAQKTESLGLMAGGIAHDFNNLLVGITANAAEALQELPESEPARERIADIERASEGAADLVRQLLAYTGKGRREIVRLDLSELVRETARMLRVRSRGDVIVEYELSEEPVWVEADAVQMRQVVMNLITNALQSLGESGVATLRTGVVSTEGAALEEYAIAGDLGGGEFAFFEVQDTGCGMDAKTLEQIFDPFYATKSGGRGLGLSTVSGIVRGHHGALNAWSEPGKGTTFRVLLPALQSQLALEDATPHPPRLMKVEPAQDREAPPLVG